jgi:hypothetical protein
MQCLCQGTDKRQETGNMALYQVVGRTGRMPGFPLEGLKPGRICRNFGTTPRAMFTYLIFLVLSDDPKSGDLPIF